MLDKFEKPPNLIAAVKAAIPFEAEMTPTLMVRLRAEPDGIDLAQLQIVRDVSYAGTEGGILCHIDPDDSGKRLLFSLTRLRVCRSLPFAAAALDDQKHRVKKLKKQQRLT